MSNPYETVMYINAGILTSQTLIVVHTYAYYFHLTLYINKKYLFGQDNVICRNPRDYIFL